MNLYFRIILRVIVPLPGENHEIIAYKVAGRLSADEIKPKSYIKTIFYKVNI